LDLQGFAIAAIGPILVVIFCELYKLVSSKQIKAFADRLRKQQDDEESARLNKFAEVKTTYIED